MAMFSNWITKGAQVITNGAKSIANQHNQTNEMNAILKQLLNRIEIKLSKQLGEDLEGSLDSIKNQLLKQSQLQKTLLEIKQKYNNLVSQADLREGNMKQMIQYFIETLTRLGILFENQDMLTPLKDIENAFYTFNKPKVEKQLKYFTKLCEAAVNDFVKGRISKIQQEKKDEVNLFKNLNKNLEVQLFRSRNNLADVEKRLNEIHSKNQQLNEKIAILEKLGSENLVAISLKQKQKSQQREVQYQQKIKFLQKQKAKLERLNKQLESENLKLNGAVLIIKNNQQKIMEEMSGQISKKQMVHQSTVTKLCGQKCQLEQKIKQGRESIQMLKQEIGVLRKKEHLVRKQGLGEKNLSEKIKELEFEVERSKKQMDNLVRKQIMRNLFMSYEDESKQWSVRRNIKNQIHLLLDIKSKTADKAEQKKWFGIF